MMKQVVKTGLVFLLGFAPVAGVQAEETAEGWRFEITPYAWLAGLEGDLTLGGRKVDFDKSFSDLFDATDVAGSIRLGAQHDRFLVGALLDYFSLSTDELDVDDQPNRGTLDADLFIAEVAVGYQVDGIAEGQRIGLMAGVRHTAIDNKLTLDDGKKVERDNELVDAMFYVLPSIPVFPSRIDGLRFNPAVGVGAGDSDLAYELFPHFQYMPTELLMIRAGYRTAGWEVEGNRNGDNELDISMSGVIIGLGVKL
jgi:hypothetical protein